MSSYSCSTHRDLCRETVSIQIIIMTMIILFSKRLQVVTGLSLQSLATQAASTTGGKRGTDRPTLPLVNVLVDSGGYVQRDAAIKNMTRYEGETGRINCEITGFPLPRYHWYKDGQPLNIGIPTSNGGSSTAENRGRLNVKTTPWGSRLKISALTISDSGRYACEGFNRFGRQLEAGFLTVKSGSNPNRTWLTGPGSADLTVQSAVDPDPDMVEGLELLEAFDSLDKFSPDVGGLHVPRRLYKEQEEYKKKKVQTMPRAYSDVLDKLALFVGDMNNTSALSEGGCEVYTGTVCLRYLHHSAGTTEEDRGVLVRSTLSQRVVEEKLTELLLLTALLLLTSFEENDSETTSMSRDVCSELLSFLCSYFFTPCHVVIEQPITDEISSAQRDVTVVSIHNVNSDQISGGRVCREDCHSVWNGPCKQQLLYIAPYIIEMGCNFLQYNVKVGTLYVIGNFFRFQFSDEKSYDTVWFLLADCHLLPSGKIGKEGTVTCLTLVSDNANGGQVADNGDSEVSAAFHIVLPFSLLLITLSLSVVVILVLRIMKQHKNIRTNNDVLSPFTVTERRRQQQQQQQHGQRGQQQTHCRLSQAIPDSLPAACSSSSIEGSPAVDLSISNVTLTHKLGEGTYGTVYVGELQLLPSQLHLPVSTSGKVVKSRVNVCLWTNQSRSSQDDRKQRDRFSRDISLLSKLRHQGVMSVLGADISTTPLWVILEFVSMCDLHKFLLRSSSQPTFNDDHENWNGRGESSRGVHKVARKGGMERTKYLISYRRLRAANKQPTPSVGTKLYLCGQISSGLSYLNQSGFIHRDIAARHIQITEDLVAKISLLGCTRDDYPSHYFRLTTSSAAGDDGESLPVRWMSPEVLGQLEDGMERRWTVASDVWAYGCLIWEIFTTGRVPFDDYRDDDVIRVITRGLIPSLPDQCPLSVYSIMSNCWRYDPLTRPTIDDIHRQLDNCYQSVISSSRHYVNNSTVGRMSQPFPMSSSYYSETLAKSTAVEPSETET